MQNLKANSWKRSWQGLRSSTTTSVLQELSRGCAGRFRKESPPGDLHLGIKAAHYAVLRRPNRTNLTSRHSHSCSKPGMSLRPPGTPNPRSCDATHAVLFRHRTATPG